MDLYVNYEDINAQFLVENYLFGVPLEDLYGNKMGEGLLEHYIKSAILYTQRMLQVIIEPQDIVDEVHDYYQNDFMSWSFLQLHKRPIIEVNKLQMNFGEYNAATIPKEWIRQYEIPGQIQLFPTQGSAGSMIIAQNGSFLPLALGQYSSAPGIWRVSYRAGMEKIPHDLVEYIMKRASIGILQVWGDLIIGAGIANQTISIDGLSQSIGTTQSPEFSGAGARIKNYSDDMKDLERRLKDTYLGISMGLL